MARHDAVLCDSLYDTWHDISRCDVIWFSMTRVASRRSSCCGTARRSARRSSRPWRAGPRPRKPSSWSVRRGSRRAARNAAKAARPARPARPALPARPARPSSSCCSTPPSWLRSPGPVRPPSGMLRPWRAAWAGGAAASRSSRTRSATPPWSCPGGSPGWRQRTSWPSRARRPSPFSMSCGCRSAAPPKSAGRHI